jgi:hypothetical protein
VWRRRPDGARIEVTEFLTVIGLRVLPATQLGRPESGA